ncbi:MAG TPA: hypothetical protein VIJ04_06565 [Xanthobacteraceae bacterium]
MRDGVGLTLAAARKFSENAQVRIKSAGRLSFEIITHDTGARHAALARKFSENMGPFSDQAGERLFGLAL